MSTVEDIIVFVITGASGHLGRLTLEELLRAVPAEQVVAADVPVLRVWEAAQVVMFKRSMAAGYAGVQNPLFFRDNSHMLFGDRQGPRRRHRPRALTLS